MSKKKVDEQVVSAIITDRGTLVLEREYEKYAISTTQDSKSKQIDDNKWKSPIIEPPHDLARLMNWMNLSVTHQSCVSVKTQDCVGRGYIIKPVDEESEAVGEDDAEYVKLKNFCDLVNPTESLIAVLKKVFVDYEGCGNGYLEVVRDISKKDEVKALYHVNATTIRWCKERDRVIQRINGETVYFKLFGEERTLDRKTGTWLGEGKEIKNIEDAANEIIPIVQYSYLSSVYGLPQWLPALYSMFANMKEMEFNIDFFLNYGVPAYAVIVEGSTTTPEFQQTIEKYFQTTLKGSNHKTITLSTPRGATIKFERLSVEQKEASFRVYRKDNRDEILSAHRVPSYRIGIVEQGQLGGSVSAETDRIYLDSVVDPRQVDFAWVLNHLIVAQGLSITKWVIDFIDLNIDDSTKNSDIFTKYISSGVMTPNEVRKELGLVSYEGGDVFYVSSSLIPVGGEGLTPEPSEPGAPGDVNDVGDAGADNNALKKPAKPKDASKPATGGDDEPKPANLGAGKPHDAKQEDTPK